MPRQVSAKWKKRQAEILFDDFIKIRRHKDGASKDEGFEGEDVVPDASKRFSGTFTRQARSLQSRSPKPDVSVNALLGCSSSSEPPVEYVAEAGASEESSSEEPSEECIHRAAEKLSFVADQLDDGYSKDKKESKDLLLTKLREMGSNLPYNVFAQLLSEVIPKDRDIATFYFVMQLSSQIIYHLGFSFTSHFRHFISEEFADEAAACIEEES